MSPKHCFSCKAQGLPATRVLARASGDAGLRKAVCSWEGSPWHGWTGLWGAVRTPGDQPSGCGGARCPWSPGVVAVPWGPTDLAPLAADRGPQRGAHGPHERGAAAAGSGPAGQPGGRGEAIGPGCL